MAVLRLAELEETQPLLGTNPEEVAERLLQDALELYEDISELNLRSLWRIVRDVVVTLDRWAERIGGASGAERMEIALAVCWELLDNYLGVERLRDLIVAEIKDRPFGRVTGWIARRILTEGTIRRLLRFVINLAVSELRVFKPRTREVVE
jgi:hypothetical protein